MYFVRPLSALVRFVDSGRLASRVDPMTLKEWYDIKAPSIFQVRNPGKTLVTRTKGTSELFVLNPGVLAVVLACQQAGRHGVYTRRLL